MTIKICVSKINQSVCCPMEKNASIHAVFTVSTRRVTESMVVVCMVVKKGSNAMMVYLTNCDLLSKVAHCLIKYKIK